MAKFVVTFRLPAFFDEDFMALIPRHRAFINQLLEDNIIEAYAISADRGRGWVTMNGQHAGYIKSMVEQFPLYRFLREVEINELFIFDSAANRFPRISLN